MIISLVLNQILFLLRKESLILLNIFLSKLELLHLGVLKKLITIVLHGIIFFFLYLIIILFFSVTGARILNDTRDLREEDVGILADLYEIKKIGDEYFTYVTSSKSSAVTIVLRGPSKDIINEVERNINDAVNCVRNVLFNSKVVPGAGAIEMALSRVSFKWIFI